MTTARKWVVPHIVEFEPQLREAFLTIEDYFAQMTTETNRQPGIFWWDGNGDPNSLPLPLARGGDFFIDQLTGDVWRLVGDGYTRSLTPGENESRAIDTGSMWWDDDADPATSGDPYRTQDYWLNTTTCDIFALRP
jgi:hypothetical protein